MGGSMQWYLSYPTNVKAVAHGNASRVDSVSCTFPVCLFCYLSNSKYRDMSDKHPLISPYNNLHFQ